MNKVIKITKEDLLKKMADELVENEIAAKYEKEKDEEVGRLYILLEEFGVNSEQAAGQFYFEQSLSEDEDVLLFTGLIMLAKELPEEKIKPLSVAMAVLNAKIPCGTFAITADENALGYKLVTPVSSKLGFDMLYEQLNILISSSTYVAETYSELLINIIDGSLDIDDLKNAMGE